MNTRFNILFAAVLLPLAISCQQDDQPDVSEKEVISFSVETGHDSSTKTAYAGGNVTDEQKERIDWVIGDQFKLSCAQTTPGSAGYKVTGNPTNSGVISKVEKNKIAPVQDNGLQWGTGTHHFYAVYPSSASVSTSGVISATIPAAQDGSNMNNCLMWAGASTSAKTDFSLRFTPMVTTFQFTVGGDGTGAGDITISKIELVSANVALAGSFSAQITQGGGSAEIQQRGGGIGYSSIPAVVTSGSGMNNTVTINLTTPVTINDATSYTFKIFVYPSGRMVNSVDVMDGLTIRYYTSAGNRSLALKYSATHNDYPGQWVQFPAGRKININNLQLPAQLASWTFSVSAGNMGEEISDIVVSPVSIEEFQAEDGGLLEDLTYILDVDWNDISWNEGGGSDASFATVRSHKDNAEADPVPYQLEYYDENSGEWLSGVPSWLSVPAPASNWAGSGSGESLGLTMSAQVNSATDSHRSAMLAKGSYSAAHDLSTDNPATGETVSATTANCYIADRPGLYKFPLVYGNGIKNGAVNTTAFEQGVAVGSAFLTKFKDHLDQDINSPYIGVQHSGKTLTPALIWTDAPGLVTDLSVTGSGSSAYLNFSVPSESITQGNALVGVLVDGEIAWSWHIWVTDQSMKVSDSPDSYMGSNNYVFAPVNLGWCGNQSKNYAARSVRLRVVQPASGLMSDEITVSSAQASYTTYGDNPFFQWGRKDPIRPVIGTYGNPVPKTLYYGSADYTADNSASGPVSIGTAIQTPWNNYITGATTSNWCSDNWYNLWNANLAGSGSGQFGTDVIKTIYDPSPVGFMVPPQEAYDGFTTSNCAGVNLSAGNTSAAIVYNSSPLSFPLTGYLYAIDGSYNYVGRVGHYWSAVPDGSLQAYPLTVRYSSGIVSTTGPLGRSYAVSVRPVLEEVSQSGVAEEGCFAVSILQDKFSTAGGTSSIEICSSAFTVDNGYYSSCAPGLAWHVAGFSTNRTTWSTTAPSWFSISRMSARPSGDEDIQFTFSVASAPSETNRFVMVKIVQDCTDQTVILYISQGATAGASSWETNLLFGADNSVCGSGNTVLGSGNFIMGYDNRSEGTGNISIGYENTSIGNNNNSIGTGNYNRGTGNVCCGTYNTCWGSYNRCGGSWQSAYEQIVIGDSNWISWFGN